MSFVAVDEWIRETEDRRAGASPAGDLFFALPETREASAEELAVDDHAAELERHRRARNRKNARAYRERRRRTLFHGPIDGHVALGRDGG